MTLTNQTKQLGQKLRDHIVESGLDNKTADWVLEQYVASVNTFGNGVAQKVFLSLAEQYGSCYPEQLLQQSVAAIAEGGIIADKLSEMARNHKGIELDSGQRLKNSANRLNKNIDTLMTFEIDGISPEGHARIQKELQANKIVVIDERKPKQIETFAREYGNSGRKMELELIR